MLFVGERVDDVQILRGAGKSREPLLSERADDRGGDPTLEIAGHVLDRLASAERDLGRRLDDFAAELAHGDHRRRPRAKGRLFEQERDVHPGQRLRAGAARGALALHLGGQLQHALELDVTEIEDRQKVFRRDGAWRVLPRQFQFRHARRFRRSAHVRYSELIRTYSALKSHVHIVNSWPLPVPRSTVTATFVSFKTFAA